MVIHKITRIILTFGLALAGITLLSQPFQSVPINNIGTRLDKTVSKLSSPIRRASLLKQISHLESLGEMQALSSPAEVSFREIGQHILVETYIEGMSKPLSLILDSGVKSLILQRSLAGEISLEDTVDFTPWETYGLVEQASIGAASFNQIGAYVVNFSTPGHPLYCLSEHGVIGASLMKHGVWQIDYEAQTITIAENLNQLIQTKSQRQDHRGQALFKVPMSFQENRPFIQLEVGHGRTIEVMVDTGWGGHLQLNRQDLSLQQQSMPPVATIQGVVETLKGLSAFEQRVVSLAELTLGDLVLHDYEIFVNDSPPESSEAAIGNDFLRHFVVTFDWPGHMLYLEPIDRPQDMSPRLEGYGFQSMAQGQSLWVTGLYHPSPAADAGLQVGDQIVSINGDSYHPIPADQPCDYLLRPVGSRYSGPITVTVIRQETPMTFRMAPDILL